MSKSASGQSPAPNRDAVARKSAHGATIAAIGAALAVLLVIWYVVGAINHGTDARSQIKHQLDDTQSKLANLETEFRKQTGVAPEQFETTTSTTTTTTVAAVTPPASPPARTTTRPTSAPTTTATRSPTTAAVPPPSTPPPTAAPPPSTTTTTTRNGLPCVTVIQRCP